ncbi:MAG: hypothetical protein ACFE0I_03570 [Elainellaceae cyanobacterium]
MSSKSLTQIQRFHWTLSWHFCQDFLLDISLMSAGQRIRYNRWRSFEHPLAHRPAETRWIREIIFAQRRAQRYFEISKGTEPEADSWFIMSDLSGDILQLPLLYSLRNWIEYGFKQVKSELGWADFRVTDYASIER